MGKISNPMSGEKGFTLLEFLVSVVILTVGLLGLLTSVNYAVGHNMENQLRDEAVNVADMELSKETAKSFDNVSTSYAAYTYSEDQAQGQDQGLPIFETYSVVRNVKNKDSSSDYYQINSVNAQGSSSSPTTKIVEYYVSWKYRGVRYQHNVSAAISKSSN